MDPQTRRSWYEQLLDGAGGRTVRTRPFVFVWVAVSALIALAVWASGGNTAEQYILPMAVASGPFWFLGVPLLLHYRRRAEECDG